MGFVQKWMAKKKEKGPDGQDLFSEQDKEVITAFIKQL